MPITAITPEFKNRTEKSKVSAGSLSGADFSTVASAIGNTGAAVAGLKSYQGAAVTAAAVSGIAGAPAAFGGATTAPYGNPYNNMSTASFAGGGYGYGGATFAGGANGYSASVSVPGAGVSGAPSQDFQEKQYLFQQMNDANWQMLVAQVTVNDLSRDYQARSNILKSKNDAEANTVRNFRA